MAFQSSSDHNLLRFLTAQESTYDMALSEITRGKKQSHWMWFIFPQIQGLGFSETSKRYAVKDLREAEAFMTHLLLGNRLVTICEALMQNKNNDAYSIFGSPDDMKLLSCMTLFSSVKNAHPFYRSCTEVFWRCKRWENVTHYQCRNLVSYL